MADVYNTEFRDNAGASAYPLDPSAKQTVIPKPLLLDLSIYAPSTFNPPFFFISIDGGIVQDKVRFTIGDARRQEVGYADCDLDEGTAVVRDQYGRSMGVLVYDPVQMESFKGTLGTKDRQFVLNDTRLQSECFRFYDVKACHSVVAARTALTNLVSMTFAGGVQRDKNGNVNIYGEESDLGRPVKSINRVKCEHAFLLAHVHDNYDDESALRIETENTIKIGKSRDFV
jgi:hypothetical protein